MLHSTRAKKKKILFENNSLNRKIFGRRNICKFLNIFFAILLHAPFQHQPGPFAFGANVMSAISLQASPPIPAYGAAEVRAMPARLLASAEFAKARSMSKLLSYLVEMLLSRARELNEYMIGIEVFARHPATCNTGDAPIVRVQVGRLRERLWQYYASGKEAELLITIPLGSYMPSVRRLDATSRSPQPGALLALQPLSCLSTHASGREFTAGLNEQMAYQLFFDFGRSVISHTFAQDASACRASHRIEGSLRLEGQLTRVSIRLVQTGDCTIAWSHQFDFSQTWSIRLQEELAELISAGLKQFFAPGGTGGDPVSTR